MYRKIKELREKKGLSLQGLSDATGISKSTLQRYETGTTKKIPVDAIKKMEQALGASLAETEITPEDSRDISVMLQNVLGQLSKTGPAAVMFGGEALDDKSRKLLTDSLKNSMEMAKLISKKRTR